MWECFALWLCPQTLNVFEKGFQFWIAWLVGKDIHADVAASCLASFLQTGIVKLPVYRWRSWQRSKYQCLSVFQYEREIERLKCSVELLRGRLGPAEPGSDHTDAKMKAIISRYVQNLLNDRTFERRFGNGEETELWGSFWRSWVPW